MTELWVEVGGLRCSEERTRARRSELATVSSLRPHFWRESEWKERVDASTASGASPWRSCARWELTSGAITGIRVPFGGQVALWTFPTASSSLNQATRSECDRATSAMNNFQTRAS